MSSVYNPITHATEYSFPECINFMVLSPPNQYPTLDDLDAMAFGSARFGAGKGSIPMDEVRCTGSEGRLVNCRYTTQHDCSHSEDALVRCYCSGESIGK